MKVRVEYEITPIRHLAIQCPECDNWFYSSDLTDKHLGDMIDVECADYHCPICSHSWTLQRGQWNSADEKLEIEECNNREQVYRDTKEKKTIWE